MKGILKFIDILLNCVPVFEPPEAAPSPRRPFEGLLAVLEVVLAVLAVLFVVLAGFLAVVFVVLAALKDMQLSVVDAPAMELRCERPWPVEGSCPG